MNLLAIVSAAVLVGSWNGQWFPSGRAEHRASEAAEAATVRAAGEMIRRGIARHDPAGTNDLILCFNEIRDRAAADALCAAIGRTNLTVAMITRYRRRDRFDMQQDVIMTTLPVTSANWCRWKFGKGVYPPRGYAHADIVVAPAVTAAVYAVHLKSNYGQTTEKIAADNRAKREKAVEQLLAQEKKVRGKYRRPVIIAGDLNADRWGSDEKAKRIFEKFDAGGFVDVLADLAPEARITHPGRGKWKNSTLDYIMIRGFPGSFVSYVESARGVSDHDAVFVLLDFE